MTEGRSDAGAAAPARRLLVAGWFSFHEVVATVGDLLARDVACRWLDEAGVPYDVASVDFAGDGVDWRSAVAGRYSDLLFVCGPFGDRPLIAQLLERFAHCRLHGVNLTILEPEAREPFHMLFEREGEEPRPDIAFGARTPQVPVAGIALTPGQDEYDAGRHDHVREAVDRLVAGRDMAVVDVDTNLFPGGGRLRTPAEVESLMARTDVVVTNRLHGLVLALKSGVPAVVVDPIAGGAKVSRQAETVGWPAVLAGDSLEARELERAFDWCLTDEAREEARRCRDRAETAVGALREEFLRAIVPAAAEAAR